MRNVMSELRAKSRDIQLFVDWTKCPSICRRHFKFIYFEGTIFVCWFWSHIRCIVKSRNDNKSSKLVVWMASRLLGTKRFSESVMTQLSHIYVYGMKWWLSVALWLLYFPFPYTLSWRFLPNQYIWHPSRRHAVRSVVPVFWWSYIRCLLPMSLLPVINRCL